MGRRVYSQKQHYWYKALLLGLFFSAAFFIPFIVRGEGYFLYYGDFNVQQVPFYKLVHDAIRSGNWQWSTTTDLGSSLIGSYTFYLLGSPFFWLTLPFPSDFLPYLMGPLLILKFGVSSLTGYIYLRRYTRDKNNAVIGGLLYAFSGYSVYNIFFNHFHEAIVIFPLLLAAIDEYMDNHRRGVVALAVFAACLMNYYFFVGMVAFVVIYWFLRVYINAWKINMRDFITLAFEVIIGFTGTAALLVPTALFVIQNPRVNDFPCGFGALLYNSEQRYLHIISSFFFPPDIPARPNFTPDSNSKWASVAAWLPVFGMTGVIGFLKSNSKGWLKKLLPFLFLCTLIPVLNAIFQMFVMTYYARWFFMLTLMMSLATVLAIENSRTKWKDSITMTTVITLAIAFGIGLMPNEFDGEPESIFDTIGLEEYPDRFWAYVAIAMSSIAVTVLLIRALKRDRKSFFPKAVLCVGLISSLYAGYIVGLGSSHSYDIHDFVIPHVINQEEEIHLDDDLQNVRSDFFETMDNVGMFWQIPNIQAFQSIVPGSIYEFYPTVGVTRDVGSRPEPKYYGLRSLLSVKYVFDYEYDDEKFKNDEGQTRMPGYEYIDTQNGFNIFRNKNYIPYGFYFDSYITEEQYNDCTEDNRHLLLLKAMVLNDEQAEKYGDLMTHIEDIGRLSYDPSSFSRDCAALNENTCSSFEYGKGSFTAEITTPEGGDRLVFFSIPFENGWSATVNGEKAKIEKVDLGFMAVRVSGGRMSKIRFEYQTPGLFAGIIVSAVSILIYIVYLIVSAKKNKLKPMPKLKKQYKVAAFGSADELGGRYKNLVAGRNPMSRKPTFKDSVSVTDDAAVQSDEQTVSAVDETAEAITESNETPDNRVIPDETAQSAENRAAAVESNAPDHTENDEKDSNNPDEPDDSENDSFTGDESESKTVEDGNSEVKLSEKSDDDKYKTIDGIIVGNLEEKVTEAKGKEIFQTTEHHHHHHRHHQDK